MGRNSGAGGYTTHLTKPMMKTLKRKRRWGLFLTFIIVFGMFEFDIIAALLNLFWAGQDTFKNYSAGLPLRDEVVNEHLFWVGFFGFTALIGFSILRRGKEELPFRAITQKVDLKCPHCQQKFNVARHWTCGYCSEEYDHRGFFQTKFITPLDGCIRKDCRGGSQTAIKCPECGDHIIMEGKKYAEFNSANGSHPGVAVYSHDSKPHNPSANAPSFDFID